MRPAGPLLILLLLGLCASARSKDAHHFYSNSSGHVLPRAGNIYNISGHIHPRAVAFICHGIQDITLSNGQEALLESPGYPNKYPNKKKCGWNIKASDDSVIDISCPVFDLQKPNRRGVCNSDYLSIDGFKFCGKESMTATITNGDSIKMIFRSNGKRTYPGFKCRADALAPPTMPSGNSTNSCECGQVNRGQRIVGGKQTDVNEYPWQAALVPRRSSKVFCGGTLINSRYVLTAAHCTAGLKAWSTQVLLGNHLQKAVDSAEKRFNVRSIINHPSYNKKNMDHDFALLELATPLNLTALAPAIQPACLPDAKPENKYDGVAAVVSGWGALSSGGRHPNALQEAEVNTMTNNVCNKKYGNGEIQPAMLCASGKGKDSCQGDSGGPLVTNEGSYYSVIGVVSWGYECASKKFPGVYARVSKELDWIKRHSHSGGICAFSFPTPYI